MPWHIHRDVVAVDGNDLAGREQRLRQRFSGPGIDVRALRLAIIEDSSRHNLGHIGRNITFPTFPMVVLHRDNQWRFAFRDRGTVAESGRQGRLISFRERGRLRVIRDRNGRDVQTEGSMLLDGVTGEQLRASVEPRAVDRYSHLEVTFCVVDGVSRRVPVQMWEWYWQQGSRRDRYVEGLATYDSFRRFTTTVAERGLSFDLVAEVDWQVALVLEDTRRQYGETRCQALGMIRGRLHMVVVTFREAHVRVISLRRANAREERLYATYTR